MNLPTPRHSIADRYPSAQPARDGADDSSGSRCGSGEPGDRRYADGPATWPRALSGLEQFHAAARARQSSRDADLADRGSAEEFAGELDDDHVLARLASASWPAEQPATLSTGIPRVGRCAHQATPSGSRQGGHGGQADRLLAPVLLPILLPGWTISALLPTAGTPKRRAELRELPCWKSRHRGVYLLALQEVRGHFSRSKYGVDLRKHVA